uniref:Major facilitator superfamily (MFS) profile domain-containing protein n=1 Tax=Ornithorhynchus anatinus TaxID=9258 RepID=A0A6I8NWK3_ORNAN
MELVGVIPVSKKLRVLCSVRHSLAFVLHFSFFVIFSQRVSLSIAIVAMVQGTGRRDPANHSTDAPAGAPSVSPSGSHLEYPPEGVIIPAQFTLWAKWAPPLERSRLVNFSSAGISFGIFLTLIVGGVISHSLGWPSIFYIFGGVGCVCCLLWFSLVYKDPQSHPFIGASEKEFITSSLTQQGSSHGRTVPISAMLTSLPLWAISVAFFSNYWLYITLLTSLPMYMKTVLHFNIREGGFLSSLPYIASWFSGSLVGLLADLLLSKNICSLITLRKLFSALGKTMLIPSAFLVAVSYMDSNYITAVVLLTLSLVIRSLSGAGCLINHMDIAPRYAAQSLPSTFGTISGVITPSAVGFFTSQDASAGWRKVFFLSAAINLFGLIFYVIFGKVEIQDWARVELELR